jgi:uncharacterized membrane protein YfcA
VSPLVEGILFVTATLTGTVSATLGMAGGFILLSVLTVFMPMRDAVPLHGFAQFCSNVGRVITFWKDVDRKLAFWFSLLVVPGAFLGVQAMNHLNQTWVEMCVGAAILIVVNSGIMRPAKPRGKYFFTVLGFISSSVGMVAGATGPMIAPFFMGIGLNKNRMIATKAYCQSIVQLIKLPFFAAFGGVSLEKHWHLLVLFAVASALGAILGRRLVDWMSERTYERIVKVTVIVLAARMFLGAGWTLVQAYKG